MALDRRNFLKQACMAMGAAAATQSASGQTPPPAPAGPTTPLLTPDGKVVHLPIHQATSQPAHGGCHSCRPAPGSKTLPPAADATGREGVPGRRWVMVIDLAKCDGCAKCTEACGKMHFIPPDRQWIPVLVLRENAASAPYYFPRPCFHCDNPPCTKVCPVSATYKTGDGTVLIDNERCIGCRFCIAACPYGARTFNWGHPENPDIAREYSPEWGYPRRVGTVEKCDFCPDHAATGELPGCVSGCPMQAILYGDQQEDAVTDSSGQTFRLSQLLRDRAAYRHMEELGTQPRVYYLPPVHRQFPAPDQKTPGEKG